jgi:hypothetical protein
MFFKQITLFEKLSLDGNPPLISLHELNAQAIVHKLAIIEKDAKVIWKALEDEYGFGYFRKVIEENYGLFEDLEKLKNGIMLSIMQERSETITKIDRVSKEARLEITKREFQIQDKNTEIANVRNGLMERLEQLRHTLKINIENEA